VQVARSTAAQFLTALLALSASLVTLAASSDAFVGEAELTKVETPLQPAIGLQCLDKRNILAQHCRGCQHLQHQPVMELLCLSGTISLASIT
jgi:hypothetical protein